MSVESLRLEKSKSTYSGLCSLSHCICSMGKHVPGNPSCSTGGIGIYTFYNGGHARASRWDNIDPVGGDYSPATKNKQKRIDDLIRIGFVVVEWREWFGYVGRTACRFGRGGSHYRQHPNLGRNHRIDYRSENSIFIINRCTFSWNGRSGCSDHAVYPFRVER